LLLRLLLLLPCLVPAQAQNFPELLQPSRCGLDSVVETDTGDWGSSCDAAGSTCSPDNTSLPLLNCTLALKAELGWADMNLLLLFFIHHERDYMGLSIYCRPQRWSHVHGHRA
jgi:hypothetical protein